MSDTLDISHLQLRFAWFTNPNRCSVQSVKSFQLTLIVALITNITLLLIVIAGLLRLRHSGGGSFGLQRVLWNQVRWFLRLFPFVVVLSSLCVASSVRVSFGFCLPSLPRSHPWYVPLVSSVPPVCSSGHRYLVIKVFILNMNSNSFSLRPIDEEC